MLKAVNLVSASIFRRYHFQIILLAAGVLGCSQALAPSGAPASGIQFMPTIERPAAEAVAAAGHIAFISNRDGPAEIYVMNADGSNPHRITQTEGGNSWPSFSPDGTRIVFESTVNGVAQVFVMNADGTQPRSLSSNHSSDEFPSWSPDGSHIAFTSDRDGHVAIYVMNEKGGDIRRLTDDPSNNWFPVWSPDSAYIAFISDRDGSNGNVFLMDTSGNHLQQVTTGSTLAAKPSWAPDSRHIAVFNGGGFLAFARDGSSSNSIASEGEDPAWSPDGRWIAFASRRDTTRLQIYLTTPDGSTVRRITKNNAEDWEPAWGP